MSLNIFRRKTSQVQRTVRPAASASTADFEVLITAQGIVKLNGATLPSNPASFHQTVLDELHRYARIQNLPVTAVITDEMHQRTFHIEVLADGSSELVGPAPSSRGTRGTALVDDGLDQETATLRIWSSSRSEQVSPDSTVTESTPPESIRPEEDQQPQLGVREPIRHQHAEGHETRGPTASIPDELALIIAQVNEAVAAGALTLAESFVDRLVDQSEELFGPEHVHTLEAYALDGYIALLRGDHAHSTDVSLHLARLRLSQGDVRAEEEVKRAAGAWYAVESPVIAVAQGKELLSLLEELAEEQGERSEYRTESLRVRDRLSTLITSNTGQAAEGPDSAG